LTIASTVACGIVIISMISLSDISSMVVVAITYGFVSGVCMFHTVASIISGTNDARCRAGGPADD
jgi:hypothetical protein